MRHALRYEGGFERNFSQLRSGATEYQSDESDAAVADLFLARALQQGGYDRAALERYATLLRRVQGRSGRGRRPGFPALRDRA